MKLHENNILFRQAIQFTSDKIGIAPIYIEKDYWVTYALYLIVNSELGKDVVFKGGTSLSKCFGIIHRFSEDIDIVVLRENGETDSKMKTKLRYISGALEPFLPEVKIAGVTRKMGMNRKTAHSYNKVFTGEYGQVRDKLILESTWFGHADPFSVKSISSYVGDMVMNNDNSNIAVEYELHPFQLKVMDPERTICEKIMSLVRFSYGKNPIVDLKIKVRHSYDLHMLLQIPKYLEFVKSENFSSLLLQVAADDVISFKNNNDWLNNHPNDALIFDDLDNVWNEISKAYIGDFKNLVYGELPDEKLILVTLKKIRHRLESINWRINN